MGYYKRLEQMMIDRRRVERAKAYSKRMAVFDYVADCQRGSGVLTPWQSLCVLEEWCMRDLQSIFGGVTATGSEVAAEDAKLSARCPTLVMLMTATPVIGKVRRRTATLTIVAEDGVWKGGLRDRDNNVSLWVSGDSVDAVLDSLEASLTLSPVPWRKAWSPESRDRQKR